MAPWLNWIEQPPPKGQVAGSNPAGVAIFRVFWVYKDTFSVRRAQKSHVYHSNNPRQILSGSRLHMGQFSLTILTSTGSVLSDIQ